MIDNILLLGLWGILVGLDMASVAQTMLSRPLVAGTVAGVILGDPAGGFTIGIILEFFALEVLPVGAARYPDYGMGAVVAVGAIAGSPGVLATGLAGGLGLATAYFGGWGVHLVRMLNGRDVNEHSEQLAAGSASVVYGVHLRSLLRDTVRATVVMALGLGAVFVIRQTMPITLQGAIYLRIAVVGAAIAAAVSGTVRLTGRRVTMQWFVVGLFCGIVGLVVL